MTSVEATRGHCPSGFRCSSATGTRQHESERAKFIVSSLRDALRERKRKELLDLLDRIPSKENLDGTQSEDVLREIRSGRAD